MSFDIFYLRSEPGVIPCVVFWIGWNLIMYVRTGYCEISILEVGSLGLDRAIGSGETKLHLKFKQKSTNHGQLG